MTLDDVLSSDQVNQITAFVDVAAPPPGPSAHILFGTNQVPPVELVAARYHQGLAPVIIATGGVNRHNGIVEAREFHRQLLARGVPDSAMRYEDTSTNTWENVERAESFIREALASGLALTAVSKWFHRRAIHALRKVLPDVDGFYAVTWDPRYDQVFVTREDWPSIASGRRRVLREWYEVRRQVADGSMTDVTLEDGAWR